MFQVNKIAPTMVGNDATVKLIRMNLRVAITTVVVVMPFLLCSTPLLGGYLHLALNPSDRTSKGYLKIITTQMIFVIVNCVLDPIVFSVRLRSVRHELKRIINSLLCGKAFVGVKAEATLSTVA